MTPKSVETLQVNCNINVDIYLHLLESCISQYKVIFIGTDYNTIKKNSFPFILLTMQNNEKLVHGSFISYETCIFLWYKLYAQWQTQLTMQGCVNAKQVIATVVTKTYSL
jgi:hypothetical protein